MENLSDSYMQMGKIKESTEYASKAISYSKRTPYFITPNNYSSYASLAYCLHQAGNLSKAYDIFFSIEKLTIKYPYLWSLQGYHFFCLLIDITNNKNLIALADRSVVQIELSELEGNSFDKLLAKLCLVQLLLKYEKPPLLTLSTLNEIIIELRKNQRLYYLTHSLIVRANFYLKINNTFASLADLDEALNLSSHNNMLLHTIDCYIGKARLYVAENRLTRANELTSLAANLINQTGYHRRASELADLKRRLNL